MDFRFSGNNGNIDGKGLFLLFNGHWKKLNNDFLVTCSYTFCHPSLAKKQNLSHLSVHMANCLLRENRKSIPNFLTGKKLLKNVTLQVLNFIPVS